MEDINVEGRKSNIEGMTNVERKRRANLVIQSFDIHSSFEFRHSSLL